MTFFRNLTKRAQFNTINPMILASSSTSGVNILDFFPKSQKIGNVPSYVSYLVQIITLGAGLIAALTIVYAAYMYMSANGDQKKVEQAGSALFWGVIGLIIIVVAYWLTQVLTNFIGQKGAF